MAPWFRLLWEAKEQYPHFDDIKERDGVVVLGEVS